jgi:hypothetical protein
MVHLGGPSVGGCGSHSGLNFENPSNNPQPRRGAGCRIDEANNVFLYGGLISTSHTVIQKFLP